MYHDGSKKQRYALQGVREVLFIIGTSCLLQVIIAMASWPSLRAAIWVLVLLAFGIGNYVSTYYHTRVAIVPKRYVIAAILIGTALGYGTTTLVIHLWGL